MVLFLANQQALDCISDSGYILGKICFDYTEGGHIYQPTDNSIVLSDTEESMIAKKLASLNIGKCSIPLQDDD